MFESVQNEAVDMISDADESMNQSSQSSPEISKDGIFF